MKKEIAQKWVKALRSGKYKQGQKALKYHNKGVTRHCCLGVLCELYQQDKKQKQQKPLKTTEVTPQDACLFLELSPRGRAVQFANDSTELPPSVARWAGLHTHDGAFIEPVKGFRRIRSLAGLNDDGATFKKIADVIEQKCEEL
jgi:hypothetical protein